MSWLGGLFQKGFMVKISRKFGASGKPPDPGEKHCVHCGVQRKDHHLQIHPFKEFEF